MTRSSSTCSTTAATTRQRPYRPPPCRIGFRDQDCDDNFDGALPQICEENGNAYQTAGALKEQTLLKGQQSASPVAELTFASREASLYALFMSLQHDMAVLDGPSDPRTMWADLGDVHRAVHCAQSPGWERALEGFREWIHHHEC
jgi:hypothetical protein